MRIKQHCLGKLLVRIALLRYIYDKNCSAEVITLLSVCFACMSFGMLKNYKTTFRSFNGETNGKLNEKTCEKYTVYCIL